MGESCARGCLGRLAVAVAKVGVGLRVSQGQAALGAALEGWLELDEASVG